MPSDNHQNYSQSLSSPPFLRQLSGLLFLLSASAAFGFELAPGRPLPSLALPTASDGQPLSTDSFLGKKSLVHIFGSW